MIVNYKNVSVYQRSGEKILEGVNLEVNEGEFVYIIGRVGSGKSSLLETLYCELDVDEADEATVLDHDLLTIRRKEIPALRRELGVVFQDFQLLRERTVYKNLEFVLKATGWHDKERINDRIGEVLTMIGLEDKADKMPHELSGGEQQRVAIARAILNSPQLIIADEPTGNLDRDTADNIMQLLRSICEKGTAVIMTTHNMSLVNKYPGKAFQCHNGILEQVVVRKANESKEVKELKLEN
jgi:cell division transport system ATP-binding protein